MRSVKFNFAHVSSRLLASTAVTALICAAAHAQTNWIGTTSGSWGTFTNWSTGVVPNSSGTSVAFGAVTPINTTIALGGSTYSTAAFTLSGANAFVFQNGTLDMYGNLTDTSSAAQTFSASSAANIEFLSAATITNSGTGLLTLGGTLSDDYYRALTFEDDGTASTLISGAITASGTLTKTGTGKLEIGSSDSLSAITINAGTLQVDTPSGLGTDSVAFGTTAATALILNYNSGTTSTLGAFSGGNATDTAAVTKTGTDTVLLNSGEYFYGTLNINQGTVRAGTNASLSDAIVNIGSSGTFDVTTNAASITIGGLSGSGALNIGSTTLTVNNSGLTASPYTGALSGTGTLLVNTGANISLGGTSPGFTGTTSINGTVTLTGSLAIENSTVNINNTNGLAFSGISAATVGSLAGSSNENIGSTVLTLSNGGGNSYGGVLSSAGTSTTPSGGLIMNGTGTQTLSAANTAFYSPTEIKTGTLEITSQDALGVSTVTIDSGGTLETNSYALDLGGLSGSGTLTPLTSSVYTIGSANTTPGVYSGSFNGVTLTKTGSGTLELSGTNTFTGNYGATVIVNSGTLQADTVGSIGVNLAANAGDYDTVASGATLAFNLATSGAYAPPIQGAGSLTKTGTATLTLTGANSYSGGTTISAGTVVAGHAAGLTTSSALGSGAVTMTGGTLSVGEGINTTSSAVTTSTVTTGSLAVATSSATIPALTFNLGNGTADDLTLTATSNDFSYSSSSKFDIGFGADTGSTIAAGTYQLLTFAAPGSSDVSTASGIFSTYGTGTTAANSEFTAVPEGTLSSVNGSFAWTHNSSGALSGLSYTVTGSSAGPTPEPSAVLLALFGFIPAGCALYRRRSRVEA